ncbi:MAG TPA: hypothetical protein PKE45_05000, partial [Caldilineaceae bacterium]|nr:hypothetical protein [Caldilineaceae bacterium]
GTSLGGTPEEPTTPDGGGTPEEPTTPDGVGLRARVGSLAASAAWGEIVAAVAAAAPDSLARARKLQVTLTRTPK